MSQSAATKDDIFCVRQPIEFTMNEGGRSFSSSFERESKWAAENSRRPRRCIIDTREIPERIRVQQHDKSMEDDIFRFVGVRTNLANVDQTHNWKRRILFSLKKAELTDKRYLWGYDEDGLSY